MQAPPPLQAIEPALPEPDLAVVKVTKAILRKNWAGYAVDLLNIQLLNPVNVLASTQIATPALV
jgi:hypothetical protein